MNISGLMKTTLLDFPGHIACTVFTPGCNFRCPFCHNAGLLDPTLPPEYTEDEIFSFLQKRIHTLEGVAITGGEPTLQKELPGFIRRIKTETGLAVKLDTNGTNPAMLQQLLEEKLLSYVAMDIKSGPSGYSTAAGLDQGSAAFNKLFGAVQKSMELLMVSGIPIEFRTTVVGGLHTEQDFLEIGPFIKGAPAYYLQCYKNSGQVLCPERGFYEPKKDELLHYLELVRPYVQTCGLRGIDY